MATTIVEKVSVTELTKYGFKDATGAYINWSKNLKDSEKTPVVPGRTFDMELYVADSGKKYVNKVMAESNNGKATVTPRVTSKVTLKATPATATTMSKEEWQAKDVRISRQGVIQASVQALSGQVPVEELYTEAAKLATQMLEFVRAE